MEKFVIKGGSALSGEITAAGNKNAALPILAACLLTDEELVLSNVPRIRDTETHRSRRESEPRSCSPGRFWRASERRVCRPQAAISSAAAGSIRTSTRFVTWEP
jgi:hypothetical protein